MANLKLVKVGGPVLTGIGGVLATSSLVSKSVEEKPDEKLKTKTLTDADPLIEDWEDRNESEQESQSEDSANASDSESQEQSNTEKQDGESQPPSGQEGEEGKDAAPSGGAQGDTGSDDKSDVQQEGDSDGGTPEAGGEDAKPEDGQGEESPQKGEGKDPSSSSASEGDSLGDSSQSRSDDSSGDGVTSEGSDTATHNHASGTRYGIKDASMTKQELERTVQTRDELEGWLEKLKNIK